MSPRLLVLAGLAAVASLLLVLDDPHTPVVAESTIDTGAVASAEGRGSTWFCAGGAIGGDVSHQVLLSSTEEGVVTVRLTPFDAEGSALQATAQDIPPNSTVSIDNSTLGEGVNGVMIEFLGGSGVAAHQQRSDTGVDQETCDTAAADQWYVGAASTEIDSIAVLWLLNPYPADASVDIGASTSDGFRTPGALSGVVIPARSARAVSLGESIERRDRFSVHVETREGSGPVTAALTQIHTGATRQDGSAARRGLDLIGGRSTASTEWLFADGVGGSGYRDEVVMYNPSDEDVTAELRVVPAGVEPDLQPDPFVVEIPARRLASVVVSDESRIPPDGIRWMSVRADGDGVVADRVSTVLEGGGDGTAATRPDLSRGLSGSVASRWVGATWWFPGVGAVAADQAVVTIANPSAETIAVVDVFVHTDGSATPVAESIEVAPSTSFALDISGSITENTTVRVSSETPVVVEVRTTDESVADQAIVSGIPAAEGRTTLELDPAGG